MVKNMEIAISIEKLTKIYENNVKALDGINLEVYKGEIFTLLGPNGAGKSTLIKILIGELKPTKGKVRILGVDHERFLKSSVRNRISYVPQEDLIWENLTVEENMDLMASMYKIPKKERVNLIQGLLHNLSLYNKRKILARKLSGGMKRKLTIAMALLNEPEILIMDEPTTGLDPRARAELISDLEKLKELNKTILLTTHIVEEAEKLSDRVAIIDSGKIVKVGKPDRIKQETCGRDVLEILFESLNGKNLELIKELVRDLHFIKIGDKILIRENSHIELLEQIKMKPEIGDLILSSTIRKSTLEDAFLFITGKELK